jgi:hypothetical protein
MSSLWDRFQQYYRRQDALGLSIDIRRVGFCGALVNINADRQPGVEAGKRAATRDDPESVPHALTHLAADLASVQVPLGAGPSADTFALS